MLRACKIILNAGAAYVKTSTGFSTEGARVEDIKLIKKNVGKELRLILCKGYGEVFKTPQTINNEFKDWIAEYLKN